MIPPNQNPDQIHAVIYGVHSQDWMEAFAPDSALWVGLPRPARISCIPADPDELERVTTGCALPVVAIPLMEDHADRLPAHVARFHPSRSVSDLLRDKRRTLDYAAAQGFGTWCPTVHEDVDQVRFPCVVKRTDLNGSVGVNVAHSWRGLEALLGGSRELPPNTVIQSFIYGAKEYATYLMLEEGEILWDASFCYEMEFSDIVRRPGSAPARRVDTPRRILAQFGSFLRPLRYSGPCNVDYKIRPDGDAAIFEVNPRLGGSLMKPANLDLLKAVAGLILQHAKVPE